MIKNEALGMIETKGLIGSIEAAAVSYTHLICAKRMLPG